MKQNPTSSAPDIPLEIDISDEDIYTAMQEIHGYLDITAADFKVLYRHAYQHALGRLQSITVGELASRQVVTVSTTTPLVEVAHKMAAASISGVPVLDKKEKVVGIVSERDFFKQMGGANRSFMDVVTSCLQGGQCETASIHQATAANIMSTPAITIAEDTLSIAAAAILQENGINRLPVLAKGSDVLVGILTRSDLVGGHIMRTRRAE